MYGRNKPRLKFGFNLGKLALIGVISMIFVMPFVFFWFSRGLPDPTKIVRRSGFSTQILDRTGEEVLYDLYVDENRQFTPLSEIPDYLRNATIAIEDKDFYRHTGFDPWAIVRIAKNAILKRRLIGGSTLTQQLVKNVLLTNERTIARKIREFVLALRIEKKFSKDEILQMYLNEAPYGGTAWGVAAAAERYFGKSVSELNLTESVVLAGIPQAPSRYSPFGSNRTAYIVRAREVARRMREDGYIDSQIEKQVTDSLERVEFKKTENTLKAGHFVMYAKQLLEEMYGPSVLESGGLRVTTTLDLPLQELAEKIVAEEIEKVANSLKISNGASVVIDPNSGEILSMVGSRGYFDQKIDGQVNVTTRLRQPGSSIKPLVYATAFSKGFTPATVLTDVVTEFPGKDEKTPYIPKDYDGKERGPVKLREALGSSLNIPAVKLLALVGVRDVLEQGYKMGIESLAPTAENLSRLGLSMALGGGEVRLLDLTAGYGSFANGGLLVRPIAILKVEDKNGKVIYDNKKVKPERVLDEKVAFLINSILSDNQARLITFSPNSYLNLGSRAVAVKTGTTNDLRDNWTLGWTRDVVVGIWVGNNDNSQMKNVASGVSGAAPIWRRIMLEYLSKVSDRPFEVPSGIAQVEVDKISGYPAHDGYPSHKEWFIDGSVPTGEDPIHTKINVCRGQSDRLANAILVAQGNYDQKEAIVLKEKDPLTVRDLWQKAIDGWTATVAADLRYKIPTEYCNSISGVHVEIISPKDRSRVDNNDVEIRFEVASDRNIEWADLYIDGSFDTRFTTPPYRKTYNLTTDQHRVLVKARNSDGVESDRQVEFGVKVDWEPLDITPTTSPSATPAP